MYWAIALFALGLWAVKDGWFPSQSVMEKHPLRVPATFEQNGVVSEVLVQAHDTVRIGEILARLQRTEQESRQAAAERALQGLEEEEGRVGDGADPAETERLLERRTKLQAELVEARRALEARELRAPTNGVVRAVLAGRNAVVRAGETGVEIDPQSHFYPFNRSLAILSLLGAAVCAIIHIKVR